MASIKFKDPESGEVRTLGLPTLDNVVYVSEENQESAVVPFNADTLGGYTVDLLKTVFIDSVYPVGSIYMSMDATSPATLFGGTWERIKDTFLLSAGDTYTAGATGGEAEHTLMVDEMPSHNHNDVMANGDRNYKIGYGAGSSVTTYAGYLNLTSGAAAYHLITSNTGSDQPHNNMPPYLAVYVWKRTA